MFSKIKILILTFLIFTALINMQVNIHAQTWSPVGSGISEGVYTITENEQHAILYAGGGNIVKAWNGNTWITLWNHSGIVGASCIYDGRLYVGGSYLSDSLGNSFISAIWDGSNWQTFTVNTSIEVMLVDKVNNLLYIGGTFTEVNGVSANYVACWNGTAWSALGSGLNGWVNSLYLDDTGNLYVGGFFYEAGGIPANCIAVWDGISWSALGEGLDDVVWTINRYNGDLYAAGYFQFSGGTPVKYFARWDGVSWQNVGLGTNDHIFSSCIYRDELYIGGRFDTVDGIAAKGIAKWNGSIWSPVGSGVRGIGQGTFIVQTLAVYQDELYAAGYFDSAGGIYARNIAKWTMPVSTGMIINEKLNVRLIPNPINGNALLSVTGDRIQGTIKLYDVNGKLFFEEMIGNTVTYLNLSWLQSGIYIYQYIDVNSRNMATRKFVIQK